ncbi:MAG: pilus assembly protein N-terminal domain-containing protein, partial [Rhodopirellula sp.]|nr:pilus assembly protein N-terminal domain-containing protein [Rhodopirellula sp.]
LSQRYQEASSFIDTLTRNDAMLEVVMGQGRMIVLKEALVQDEKSEKGQPLIAVGNPDILEFEIISPRQIRLIGKHIGVTDLVVVTESQTTHSYEVHVVYDLNLVQARIRELLPDAQVRIAQMGKNLVVEGQARDATQIRQITELIRRGVLTDRVSGSVESGAAGQPGSTRAVSPAAALQPAGGAGSSGPEIINLLRVPGPQQVMLKVQVAELNRTAMRQIGSDFLFADGNGRVLGTRLNNVATTGLSTASGAGLTGLAQTAVAASSPATAFAIFEGSNFQMFVSALRQNSMLKILAEPNLVAMNGHEARFLAGGEFPVPVPQSGAGGGAATVTIQYKKFGVQLAFTPYILDGDTIRLSVDPEVSSIDFSLGTEAGGVKVPGLNTRNAHTVVELQEGQTLAIAGLMQVALSGDTKRIPGLGDLPYIGPFFSNTTSSRVEKELVVMVTPYLVEALRAEEVPPRPGDEVQEPNDLEFYLLGRLQGRTGAYGFRSTTNSDDPLNLVRRMKLEDRSIQGPNGYSD